MTICRQAVLPPPTLNSALGQFTQRSRTPYPSRSMIRDPRVANGSLGGSSRESWQTLLRCRAHLLAIIFDILSICTLGGIWVYTHIYNVCIYIYIYIYIGTEYYAMSLLRNVASRGTANLWFSHSVLHLALLHVTLCSVLRWPETAYCVQVCFVML